MTAATPQPAARDLAAAGRGTVLVTGGSSGIGLATALVLAERRTPLVLLARSAPALAEAARQCRAAGSPAVGTVVCDVTDRAAVERAFEQAGPVEAVVQAAGVIAYAEFRELPDEHLDRVLEVTLLGAANVVRTALQHFHARGSRGDLVVVGSLLGRVVTPYMSSYITAKWALHGLVRTVQVEQRRHRAVRVSLVAPGPVDTPIYEHAASRLPLGRRPPLPVDSPESVAEAVMSCLDRPRRMRMVGTLGPWVAFGFTVLPGLYDAIVTRVFHAVAMTRTPAERSEGNLFAPVEGEQVHGGWVRPGRPLDRVRAGRVPPRHGRAARHLEDECAP
ncbi:SDR family NAD(P)-dependent oxidoreductase [Serinicoccus chungangensis]|uniref:SDR family NAD(P)-dependent oxidoreductase n=1 Tax=Serinicoccus chungangensis TaxID=767452 RepID=UPI00130541BD|nr:SDR family NAD(P)-dependent oxidoreductase [Serinicoccus chungangensis]